jgi:AcrR family transcriptional regulator
MALTGSVSGALVSSRRPGTGPQRSRPRRMSSRCRQPVDHSGVGRLRAPLLDGFERERVVDIQRARLLAAMGQVACERGAGNVTVAHVVERAGVSRRTFYEIFADSEDCLLAALQDALARASGCVLEAWGSPGGWRERVRRGLAGLLCLFDEEPVLARLLVVESLSAGHVVLERRSRVLAGLTGALQEGRGERGTLVDVSRLTAEGVLGGVLAVLHARITDGGGEQGRLAELAGPLMSMIVLPYRGAAAARRELDRPLPAALAGPIRRSGEPLRSNPFKGAGMRLTYRTARVLAAVAGHPHASNRLVGERAGMSDQGQISKLLARLERIGLIANTVFGPGRGAPNAWVLTELGVQMAQRITNAQHPGEVLARRGRGRGGRAR